MADKILMEAYDKLKAIEESEDPFCIGAKAEKVEEADDPFCIGQMTENVEDDDEEQLDEAEFGADDYDDAGGTRPPEAQDARTESESYSMNTDHGDEYSIFFDTDGQAFVEVNGNTIAYFKVGGGGAMQTKIKNADALMDVITFALKAADGSGQ